MPEVQKPFSTIIDYITGQAVPEVGAEANRQLVEKLLVEKKGYAKTDIAVDVDLSITVAGAPYHSQIDLVVAVAGRRMIAVKCVAGSLGSREREIIAAARLLLDSGQIPLSVVTDGTDAIVLNTVTGKRIGEGIDAIPSREEAKTLAASHAPVPHSEEKRERESRVFRTYDLENINVRRKMV